MNKYRKRFLFWLFRFSILLLIAFSLLVEIVLIFIGVHPAALFLQLENLRSIGVFSDLMVLLRERIASTS